MKAPYRVLFSNDTTNIVDGSCGRAYGDASRAFDAAKIRASVDEAADAGVDVHLLQPGFSWIPWYDSRFYTREEHEEWFRGRFPGEKPDPITRYWLAGGDIVGDFVDRCVERQQPRFVSMRMNHNPFRGREAGTSSRFYDEHPEFLIGPPDWVVTPDWTRREVREHRFAQIREICEAYDLDGFELDFMRFIIYFDCERTDSEQRRSIMTAFVRRVREILDRTAPAGKRRWLCVRVPSELAAHDVLGLDLPAMAEAGVDMINLSCYYFTQQQNDLARICAMLPDTSVYQEIAYCSSRNTVASGTLDPAKPTDSQLRTSAIRRLTNEIQIYTTAHLAYRRGAAGVSFFNFVYYRFYDHEPPFHVLDRVRDPAWLARQPQWYFVDDHGLSYWQSEYRGMLPRSFAPGESHSFSMDLAPTPALGDGILRLMAREDARACRWRVTINGQALHPVAFVRDPLPNPYAEAQGEPEQYACFACPVADLADGKNEWIVTLVQGPAVNLRYIDLALDVANRQTCNKEKPQ
jgi:hypothetical protein